MQRRLHLLEGIVAVCALFFVLALSIGFAQAADADSIRVHPQKALQPVHLRSASALVQDADTGEIVFTKNSEAVVPIASITKLMTAMVIIDRGLDLEERVVPAKEDVDRRKGSKSRLRNGAGLTRDELLL